MTEPTSQHQEPIPDRAAPPAPAGKRRHLLHASRTGDAWTVLVAFALVLLFSLIFILQNGQRSDMYFLGAHGHLPMGVALLLSAALGVLLVAVPAAVRIAQLRLMAARRHGRTAAKQRPDSS